MDTEPTFWNKKASDLTTGESIAYVGGVTIVAMVAPLVVFVAAAGAGRLYQKIQNRRSIKAIEIAVNE